MEEEDEFKFGMSDLLWDDDKEEEKSSNKLFVEEEFLKPSDLLYEEESKNNILPEKIIINETNEISPEIRYIKYKRQEPDEEYLFSPTKLLDDESKNLSDDDEYLFKPSELIDEESLEIFNKRRKESTNINPLKPLNYKNEENKNEIINKI